MKYDLNHRNRYFYLRNDDGELVEYETLFTFECIDTENTYVVYTNNETNEEGYLYLFATVYTELDGNEVRLDPIKTQYEWSIIEGVLEEMRKERLAREDGEHGEDNKDEEDEGAKTVDYEYKSLKVVMYDDVHDLGEF